MANAIEKISVPRGYDVTRCVLSSFGGAGGHHACAVANAPGVTGVLIHPLAGALAACGSGLADVIVMREAPVEAPVEAPPTAALAASLRDEAFRPMEESARAELSAQSAPSAAQEGIGVTRRVHLRYEGTGTPLRAGADPDGCGNEPPITGSLPQPAQGAPTVPGGPAPPNRTNAFKCARPGSGRASRSTAACDGVRLAPGDAFVIETPRSGGFGEELSRTESADSRTPVTAGSGGRPAAAGALAGQRFAGNVEHEPVRTH